MGPLCRLCGAERDPFRVGDSASCGRSERERFERQLRPGSQHQAIDYIITARAAVVYPTDPAACGTLIRRPETRRRRRRRAGGCPFPVKAQPASARAAGSHDHQPSLSASHNRREMNVRSLAPACRYPWLRRLSAREAVPPTPCRCHVHRPGVASAVRVASVLVVLKCPFDDGLVRRATVAFAGCL